MTVRFVLFSLFLSTCFIGHAADTIKLETRRFEVLPKLSDVVGEHANPDHEKTSGEDTFMEAADIPSNDQYKAFFSDLGVTWPEGSKISYMATIGKVEIINTPENTERVKDILILANLIPCMIEVQVDFVEYDLKEIEKLVIDNRIDRDTLMALWKAGKGKLLSSGKAVTKNGQECVIKGVTEYLYPTEFNVQPRAVDGKPDRNAPIATVEPQNFEMREIGNILQVFPQICDYGNIISISFSTDHLNKPSWKNYGLAHIVNKHNNHQPVMLQPFVHQYNISSQLTITNGKTILIGGGMNNETGNNTVYAFFSAKTIDASGQHLLPPDMKRLFQPTDQKIQNTMETQFFHLSSISSGKSGIPQSEIIKHRLNVSADKSWKDCFTQYGVEWPDGANIKYIESINHFIVTNTPENLLKLHHVLVQLKMLRLLIETRVDFVEFDMQDINTLAFNSNISVSSLKKLWADGKARLLSCPQVITKEGQEACTKGVTEIIYPTEFHVATSCATNHPNIAISSPVVEPRKFEMRETGAILQIVPQTTSSGILINVMPNPQHVLPPTWKNYGAKLSINDLPMEQPFFHSYYVSTQTRVLNGSTVLLGGGMNNPQGDKAVYSFLTSCLTDTHGNRISTQEIHNEVSFNYKRNLEDLDTSEIMTNTYTITPAINYCSFKEEPYSYDEEFKKYFTDLGLSWPDGSSISYDPSTCLLIVKNTAQQLAILENILSTLNANVDLITITLNFVEFNTKDINTLTSKSELKIGSLHELWKQGKAKLLSNSIIQTKSGQEAIAKGVTEYIYPTEFEIKTALTPSGSVDVAEPQNFEMREAGNILQVVPEVMNGGRAISLHINPQLVSSPDWKQYGNGKNLNMQQPFFHSYSISTQVTIENGETVLLGGGMNNEAGNKSVYIFVKAEIVDKKGEPVKVQAKE